MPLLSGMIPLSGGGARVAKPGGLLGVPSDNGNVARFAAPSALAASYTLTLPGSLPAATRLLSLGADGTVGVIDPADYAAKASANIFTLLQTITTGQTGDALVVTGSNGNGKITLGSDASHRPNLALTSSSGAASIILNSANSYHSPALYLGATSGTPGARLRVDTAAAATIGMIVRAAASQTANLQEWQDSAGTVLASLTAAGRLAWGTDLRVSRSAASTLTLDGGGSTNTATLHVVYGSGTQGAYFASSSSINGVASSGGFRVDLNGVPSCEIKGTSGSRLCFTATSGTANNKVWEMYNDGADLRFSRLNDAINSRTTYLTITATGRVVLPTLPTSSTGLAAGTLWNDGGTLKVA